MKKILIFGFLILSNQSSFCMDQLPVVNFGEEETKIDKEDVFDADELINLSASEIDLESGLQLKDFYSKKNKKIDGLVLYLTTKLGIKRTQQAGNHHEVMAKYLCLIASNLEKLSEHVAQDSKDSKEFIEKNSKESNELAEKNLKLLKKQIIHGQFGLIVTAMISIASIITAALK